MKKIAILGSTGSIGTQVLDVVRANRSSLKVVSLSAHSNTAALKKQISEFSPEVAAAGSDEAAVELKAWCKKNGKKTRIVTGIDGLVEAACCKSADLVLSSVVGSVGLVPLMAAICEGKDIALANKEALVVAGDLIMEEARRRDVKILPVDSEHSAIFQCLKNEPARAVRRIILTASGGPFYRSQKELASITVEDALAHPTWIMGRKITIDSATLMNKGLEAIEAHHLFNLPLDRIDIVIHPQSIVHSLVEFVDGCVLAQLSCPDMRLPIQYAITYPERYPSPIKRLDLATVRQLQFDAPDFGRFPCLRLALRAGKAGGTMPAVMNAANEVAVESFLSKTIGFGDIPAVVDRIMRGHRNRLSPKLDEIVRADSQTRTKTRDHISQLPARA